MKAGKYECPICGYFSFKKQDVVKHLIQQDEDPRELELYNKTYGN